MQIFRLPESQFWILQSPTTVFCNSGYIGKSTAVRKIEHIFFIWIQVHSQIKRKLYSKQNMSPVLLPAYPSNVIVEEKIGLGSILLK